MADGLVLHHYWRSSASYRARIALNGLAFSHTAEVPNLMPGMTMTAEVIVGKRTVLSYFIYPLIRTVDEAVRER